MREIYDIINPKNLLDFEKWKVLTKKNSWDEWWEEKIIPEYYDFYISELKRQNFFQFHKILLNDDEFFNKIHKYMINVKWYWGDGITPIILTLKTTVLELSNRGGSSGGFKVDFEPNRFLNVSFGNKNISSIKDDVYFERKITIKDLRIKKLKKICS